MNTALKIDTIQPFNNGQWRKNINNICDQLDQKYAGIETISPFGFELLGDKQFLNKNLKRFYCYIGLPKQERKISEQATLTVIENFSTILFESIKLYFPLLTKDFILTIHQNKFIKLRSENYIPQCTDKLLDIQVRYTDNSILDDYADYIIATLAALHDGKDEARFFIHNTRFRSRTFQLYVMQECLFSHLLPTMNQSEQDLYKLIFSKINNSVNIFYDTEKLNVQADNEELNIMDELIRPRINLMLEEAKNHSDVFCLQVESYHVTDILQLQIGRKIYLELKEKIKQSYLKYE
jgi:hypothetical protein